MANEFKHKDPGGELTQAEFIAACGDGHIFACQATGDIVYASSATVLSKLAKGAANTVLSMGGSCIPAWTASPSVTDLTIGGGCITLTGAATDVDLIDNNACAISFDAAGQAGILAIDTQNCAEGVKMSGKLTVTGAISSTGALTVGVDDTGHDVKFFGAAAGAFMIYDQSCDQLEIRGASADATTSTGKLLLSTSLTNVNANDVIGSINFQAPAEAGGTDAIAIAAGIRAVAQATFTCAVNATDLIFYTGHSEAATEKFRFTSQNEIGIAGANYGTDGQVLTSGGAGAAAAWEDAGGGVVSGGTDNAILRADGTGGSTSQGSAVTIADTTGDITLPAAGQFFGGTGGSCNPGISFRCDPDTGWFRAGANILAAAIDGNEAGRFSAACFFIKEDANCKMSTGITICQDDNDNEIFALKSTDIDHKLTTDACGAIGTETDTFFAIKKSGTTYGGSCLLSWTTGNGFYMRNHVGGSGWTTHAANQGAAFQLMVYKHDNCNSLNTLSADTNLLAIGYVDACESARRFLFDKEGSAHADVGTATYDDYCDVELLRGLLATTCDQYKQNYVDKFGEDLMYNQQWYEDNKLIGQCSIHYETRPCGRVEQRAMVNFTGLAMLHHSTIIQMSDRFNARLDGLETQLKALSEGK